MTRPTLTGGTIRAVALSVTVLLLASACTPDLPIVGSLRGNAARTVGAATAPGQLAAVATFPAVSVADHQNRRLPGSIGNDRGLLLGGVGSDLWRAASDPAGEYWMVTDRGPNGKVKPQGAKERRTFPIPEYSPQILQVRVDGSTVEILSSIPIVGRSGRPVTGLPNHESQEVPYTFDAQTALAANPSGLDVEGLVRTPSGEFWAVEEYAPSLVRIDANGTVLRRYVPQGVEIDGTDYPVAPALPGILKARSSNRGFEGLTVSPDGSTLYLAIQSPLANPNPKTGNTSRNTRILAFDVTSERVTAEYVYRFEPIAEFDPTVKPAPEEMKLSALAPAGPVTLLVLERTDSVAKLYLADLSGATDILGTHWDDPRTIPSLEAVADPAEDCITVLTKSLAVDLSTIAEMPDKIEGVAIVDRTTVAVANDNDFDIGNFDRAGNNVGQGLQSKILFVTLPQPLP
jgi:hypothetical protein